jgi:hypothetical protein
VFAPGFRFSWKWRRHSPSKVTSGLPNHPLRVRIGWFEAEVVADGIAEPLFAAEVTLGGLHAHVTKQKLDLLERMSRT